MRLKNKEIDCFFIEDVKVGELFSYKNNDNGIINYRIKTDKIVERITDEDINCISLLGEHDYVYSPMEVIIYPNAYVKIDRQII